MEGNGPESTGGAKAIVATCAGVAVDGLRAWRGRWYAHVVAAACLFAAGVPWLVASTLDAAREDSERRVPGGGIPPLVVRVERAGLAATPPEGARERLASLPGVRRVTAVLGGTTAIGRRFEEARVAGFPDEDLARMLGPVRGMAPSPGTATEVAVGPVLAARLSLAPGARIPPFYRNPRGERVTLVTGVLPADGPASRSRWLATTLDGAATILAHPPVGNEFWLECADARVVESIAAALERGEPPVADSPGWTWRVERTADRARLAESASRATAVAERWLRPYGLALLSAAVLAILTASGWGEGERRRERAILLALGWTRGQVAGRSAVEALITAGGAWIAVWAAAHAWLVGATGARQAAWGWGGDGLPFVGEVHGADGASLAWLALVAAAVAASGLWAATCAGRRRTPASVLH